MRRMRHSTLARWLLALLLLAAVAWGLGELRSDRGGKPELGVGDLRAVEGTVEGVASSRPSEGEGLPRQSPGGRSAPASAEPVGDPAAGETGAAER